MRALLKVFVSIIDILLMPVRAILSLEVLVCASIIGDLSIKEMIKAWFEEVKRYPSMLKESLPIIFKN